MNKALDNMGKNAATADRLGGLRRQTLKVLQSVIGLACVYGLFAVVTQIMDAPQFVHLYNTKTILTHSVIVGLGALGMTVVIISGGIDLSVGSQIALATVVTATVLRLGGEWELEGAAAVWLPVGAALAGVAAAGLVGLFNGVMISAFRIVPFIITLGSMQIARGMAKWIGHEQTVVAPDNWLNGLMVVEPRMDVWHSLAPGVWIVFAMLIGLAFVLRKTVFGRYVFAIGSNEATARLCGVRVGAMRVWIYVLCGAMTGVAGIMQYANLTVGDPTAAVGMELDIIAAVVIGGGSLSGGQGSAVGSFVGALLMAVLRNGCSMVGVPNFVQDMLIGAIIIVAVGIDQLKHARRE